MLSPKILEFIKEHCLPCYDVDGFLKVLELLRKLGIELMGYNFANPDISGAISREDDKYTIYVNHKHHPNRQRFTITHELGHYISDRCDGYSKQAFENNKNLIEDFTYLSRDGSYTAAEIEANEIAAELLMPEGQVKAFIQQGLTIDEMAKKFIVSCQAMEVRLRKLGYVLLLEMD